MAWPSLATRLWLDTRGPGADLTGADLREAQLTGADLTGTRWPDDVPVPEGWKLDTGSGRLERAGTGSGLTEAD